MQFTLNWLLDNQWAARIVGWPPGLPFVRLGRIRGAEKTLDYLIALAFQGILRIEIMSQGAFEARRACAIARGWRRRARKVRCDYGHRRPHLRKKTYHGRVLACPKSAEYVESDNE